MTRRAHSPARFLLLLLTFLIVQFPSSLAAQFSEEAILTPASNSPAIRFGISVSIDGDTALVGAYGGTSSSSGRAYVYTRDPGTGAWQLQATLFPPAGGDSLGWFAYSVAIDGDTALIGWGRDDAPENDSGSAVVFVRESATGTWSEQQKLVASDGRASDFFGNAVAVSGDYAVIGATGNSASFSKSGAAYVFERDPSTGVWTQVEKFAPTEVTQNFAGFGASVAIAGERIVVGSSGEDVGAADSGAAYIYLLDSGTGAWGLEQKIRQSDPENGDAFGGSVALNGDTVLVGAFLDNDNGTDSGTAYVFARDSGSGQWAEQQKLTASDGAMFDQFGRSTAVLGDIAVVGASRTDAAYVFERDPNTQTWTESQKATPSITTDDFGFSLSISGDRFIVGASLTNLSRGAALIFSAPPQVVSYTVSASVAAGNGSVTCDPTSVLAGDSSTCTATPDSGWQVSGWTGACATAGTSPTCTLDNIQADQDSTVSFEAIPVVNYAVTASVAAGNGSVTCNPASVAAGGSSTCSATPDAGWQVIGWTGACAAAGTSTTCTLDNIQADQSSTVSFEAIPPATFSVTATVASGDGSVDCNPGSVTAGGSSTCTAVPDAGNQVSAWTGACAAAGTSTTCTLDNIQADQSSTVSFEVIPLNVVATVAAGNGTVSCDPASVPPGGSSTCTAVPDAGYQVSAWTGACAAAGTSTTCALDNILADQAVTVTFDMSPVPPLAEAEPVPALSRWGLALLGLLLVGFVALRHHW